MIGVIIQRNSTTQLEVGGREREREREREQNK